MLANAEFDCLAQYPKGKSKVQVAVLTGYAATGGGFNNYLGALRSRGLIVGDGDRLTISKAGIQALGSWDPLPAGAALIDYWRNRLGKAERLILEALTQAYPDLMSKEEVAAKAGYEPSGGGFNNALGRLRTLELVQGRGKLQGSDNLFRFPYDLISLTKQSQGHMAHSQTIVAAFSRVRRI